MATQVDLNIITGRTGTAHVSSADDAAIWRGLVGNSNVTLFTDQQLALNHQTKGKLVVSDGVLCIGGRMGRISNTKTVDYSLPESGYYRRTLLVARYAISNSIESMTLLTLQNSAVNDATTSDAAANLSISTNDSTDYVLYDFVCDEDGVVSGTLKTKLTVMETIPAIHAALNAEASALSGRVSTLETYKNTETSERESADTALSGRISTLESWKTDETNRQFVELTPFSGLYQGYKWYGNGADINRNDVILFVATYKENNTNYWQASFFLDMKQLTDDMVTNSVYNVNGPVISVRGGNRQRIELQVQQASGSASCRLHVKTAETYRWMIYGGTTEVHGYLNQVYNVPYSQEIEEGEAPTSIKVYRVRRVGE